MKRLANCRNMFSTTEELLNNPYIGFTSFQHFRGEKLFSDCATTEGWTKEHYPVYDWVEENGREQGYYPDTEIAYFRILWRDFEKCEGAYDYTLTDEIFKKAEEKNQSVMLRIMPHTTRQNEDVPDWLREYIDCPLRPDSERKKDSPKDSLFLKKFACAVEALGNRYDGRESFYAMDISLTGAWGEGHGYYEFSEDDIRLLVDTYLKAFKKTHLLGQVCAPELVNYANKTRPVGFRADGLGETQHMGYYLPKNIFNIKDVWRKAPVSFETFWYLTEWKNQGWDIDYIIEQSLKWHVSSINAKSSTIPYEWKDKIEAWLKKIGYRFAIRFAEYPESAKAGDKLEINLWIENIGVAPIYNKLPFTLRLRNQDSNIEFKTDIDARKWMPGDTMEEFLIELPNKILSGRYVLECRLGGGNFPIVKFAFDTECTDDGYYRLADILVE